LLVLIYPSGFDGTTRHVNIDSICDHCFSRIFILDVDRTFGRPSAAVMGARLEVERFDWDLNKPSKAEKNWEMVVRVPRTISRDSTIPLNASKELLVEALPLGFILLAQPFFRLQSTLYAVYSQIEYLLGIQDMRGKFQNRGWTRGHVVDLTTNWQHLRQTIRSRLADGWSILTSHLEALLEALGYSIVFASFGYFVAGGTGNPQ
jgi:hypothetical protein